MFLLNTELEILSNNIKVRVGSLLFRKQIQKVTIKIYRSFNTQNPLYFFELSTTLPNAMFKLIITKILMFGVV